MSLFNAKKTKIISESAPDDPRLLPGFIKKSFSMAFRGGEIWFEHLDGLYGNTSLVLEKLNNDRTHFERPSSPSLISIILDDTEKPDELFTGIASVLTSEKKRFTRVAVTGCDRWQAKQFLKALENRQSNYSFALRFENDLEKSKEWLVSEYDR